jgi:hypothetical protein
METVIVLLVLSLAAAAGVWTFCRATKGKGGCSCGQNCQTCQSSKLNTK